MEKAIIKFGDIGIEKQKFHQYKKPISIKNIDIAKMVVSNKLSVGGKGFKYFIEHKDAKKGRPLCIFLPKMTAYRKDFDETKYISFLIKDDELLKKYNKIWKNVKNTIDKEFNSDLVYSEKYLKAKIKSYNRKINTNFHDNKIPKELSQCIWLSVIFIGSVFKTGNNYFSQVFLEECKYVVKERKILKYITDDIEISSDSDREDSIEESSDEEYSDEESYDEEYSDEENSDEENSDEKNEKILI